MKRVLCVILLSAITYSLFAQKGKYEFRDLVFQCFEKIDDGKSDKEVKAWLKANFDVEESPECCVVKGLPKGFNTSVYFYSTQVVFEQEKIETFDDLDVINQAVASAIDAFKMFGYLKVVSYDYKIYDVHRKKTWRMTTDLNPYQGIARLIIKGDVKIYKSKEQIDAENKRKEEEKKLQEQERIEKEAREAEERLNRMFDALYSYGVNYLIDSLEHQAVEEFFANRGIVKSVYSSYVAVVDTSKQIILVQKDDVILNDILKNEMLNNEFEHKQLNEFAEIVNGKLFFRIEYNTPLEIQTYRAPVQYDGNRFICNLNLPNETKRFVGSDMIKRGRYYFIWEMLDNRLVSLTCQKIKGSKNEVVLYSIYEK